ncbi:hypothetical protein [Odoribacter splanchnicus]|jgi:hypothetical protein|uniref:Uncharacterized protein n=1 Tax=Odoribacter splanchnicus TaxID=28118 RepID=A0AAW6FQ12_9BACT|nr:hypothetical protein [Odoribacter splanchnicus]MDB9209240.1 hypothetical protein [Odoribacter splanchnicus]MDB9216764.1 hypothetical protein [Odoribacter splanchnicus]MDB9225022.1 hypothetical protein [Odoribacter splanchnicus]DAQ65215.1 MAG TPA: hypothetical protein [Caudoviricetes sp.]
MKTNSRDIAVIVKLIQDTRQKKLVWAKYNKCFLDVSQSPITSSAILFNPVDGVYITSYKDRFFQVYKTSSPVLEEYVLQLSGRNSKRVDKEFDDSASIKDLYLAILEQENGLDSFLDDFLKN